MKHAVLYETFKDKTLRASCRCGWSWSGTKTQRAEWLLAASDHAGQPPFEPAQGVLNV